ncbi:MAG: alpha/beta hydrolase fold domain-containing protein [Clostridia bacterium]|nr:alpha/beta hydrolase fold domain-containing protein [Clostridia bacterium]
MYIHGGGLETGSKDKLPPLLEEFIARDFSIISVNYSLYPDARFPDFYKTAPWH